MKKAKYSTPEMCIMEITPRQIICTSVSDVRSISGNADLNYEGGADEDVTIR